MLRSIFRLSIAVTSPFDVVHGQRRIVGLYRLYFAVPHVYHAVRALRDVGVMRNKYDRVFLLGRQPLQKVYDELARSRLTENDNELALFNG